MRVISSSLVAALLVGLAAAPAAAATETQRVILGVTAGADRAAIVGDVGAWRPVTGLDAITVDVPVDDLGGAFSKWASDPAVRYASKDYPVRADGDPFDPNNRVYQQLDQIAGAQAWTTGSPSVTVAVVDSGVTANADLPADRLLAGYDFVDGDTDPADTGNHGTQIANVIAAQPGNGVGGTGVCPQCRILPVRVLRGSATGPATGYASDVAAGIVWAADHGAKIVNVSASSPSVDTLMREAVDHAAARDVLVVGSAGHDATHYVGYPAALEPALAVGSVGATGLPSSSTNVNTADDHWVDVGAASVGYGLGSDGVAHALIGTSASTAIVSGAAALALSFAPDLTATDLHRRIIESASPIPAAPSYAAPVLDATRLLYGLGATDSTDPVVTTTGLTDGQLFSPTRSAPVNPVATDDHAVARMEVQLDGVTFGDWRPWARSFLLQAKSFTGEGPHQVTVRAYDYAGHVAEKSTTVVFDSVAPTGQLVQPAAEARVGPGGVLVEVTSPDAADLASVTANGFEMGRTPGTDNWATWVTPTSAGTVDVRLSDRAGNATTLTRHVVVDNVGPTATALMPAPNTRVRGTFTSTIYGVQDPSGVAATQLWANNVSMGVDRTYPYSLPVKTGTRSGTVTLIWTLTDKFGNQRSYTRYVVADNTAPTVSITSAPKNKAKVKGTIKVYVKASDWSGIARVQLLVNGKVVATDTKAPYVLSVKTAKTMKVQVRAYDKLGNVRYTTSRTWYRK